MLSRFFQYTELKTKITSTFTFVYTLAYLLYSRQTIRPAQTIVFCVSMILFDLTTTAINNYIDSRDNDQTLPYPRRRALLILYALLAGSVATGLLLVWMTDLVVLAAGAACFACGILYTFGPIPISRQPLGEVLSGFFFGYMLPFIMLYINMPKGAMLTYSLTGKGLTVGITFVPWIVWILLGSVPFLVTSNIMLANNICDVDKDITVKRFTLPYYIGKKNGVKLFIGCYALCYVTTVIMVVSGILPATALIVLLTAYPVWKNCRTFVEKQVKSETFISSIKNFILIMGAAAIGTLIGWLI